MFISMQKNDVRDNMLKIIKVAYLTQKLVRLITWASLLLGSLLFFWFTGGFPPHGWRVLAQAIANLPALWALRGPSVLLPLFVLFAYSLTLLLVWIFLISALLWAMVQQWIYLQTWRRVEQAARAVQHEKLGVTKQAEAQWHSNERKHDWETDAREGPHPTATHSPVPTMFETVGTRADIVGTGDVVRMGGPLAGVRRLPRIARMCLRQYCQLPEMFVLST